MFDIEKHTAYFEYYLKYQIQNQADMLLMNSKNMRCEKSVDKEQVEKIVSKVKAMRKSDRLLFSQYPLTPQKKELE